MVMKKLNSKSEEVSETGQLTLQLHGLDHVVRDLELFDIIKIGKRHSLTMLLYFHVSSSHLATVKYVEAEI